MGDKFKGVERVLLNRQACCVSPSLNNFPHRDDTGEGSNYEGDIMMVGDRN